MVFMKEVVFLDLAALIIALFYKINLKNNYKLHRQSLKILKNQ